MRRWQEIYTGQDREVMSRLRKPRRPLPTEKLAFVIIDTNWRTLGPRGTPILEAIKTVATACGLAGWEAVANMKTVLQACRKKAVPVIFVTGDALTRRHMGRSSTKNAPRGPLDLNAEDMPEEIAPLPGELIVRKTRASAFFDTPLDNYLRLKKIDNLLVAGNSTSGCVRASVVDACSLGYNVFVIEECCYDRMELSHLVNLFDMDAKYADVITLEEAVETVEQSSSLSSLSSQAV